MIPLAVLGLTYVCLSISLFLFSFRFYCIELDFKEISYLVPLLLQNLGKTSIICILSQGTKVGILGVQNERNSSSVRLAYTYIFGLCFISVCLMNSNCYSCSSLILGTFRWVMI